MHTQFLLQYQNRFDFGQTTPRAQEIQEMHFTISHDY
jgi:hypothetical protein